MSPRVSLPEKVEQMHDSLIRIEAYMIRFGEDVKSNAKNISTLEEKVTKLRIDNAKATLKVTAVVSVISTFAVMIFTFFLEKL